MKEQSDFFAQTSMQPLIINVRNPSKETTSINLFDNADRGLPLDLPENISVGVPGISYQNVLSKLEQQRGLTIGFLHMSYYRIPEDGLISGSVVITSMVSDFFNGNVCSQIIEIKPKDWEIEKRTNGSEFVRHGISGNRLKENALDKIDFQTKWIIMLPPESNLKLYLYPEAIQDNMSPFSAPIQSRKY